MYSLYHCSPPVRHPGDCIRRATSAERFSFSPLKTTKSRRSTRCAADTCNVPTFYGISRAIELYSIIMSRVRASILYIVCRANETGLCVCARVIDRYRVKLVYLIIFNAFRQIEIIINSNTHIIFTRIHRILNVSYRYSYRDRTFRTQL